MSLVKNGKDSLLDYIAVLSILLASGTTYFYLMHAGLTLICFLFIAMIYAIKKKFSF